MNSKKPQMRVDIGGIEIKNPVMTASGTFGYASEFEDLIDLNRLGAIVVKGLSLEPSMGNPPPRIVETPCGMLNAIGLENVGLAAFVKEKLPFLRRLDTPIFVNVYGKSTEEYAELAARLEDIDGVSGIEVNISCPNVKSGGMAFGAYPESAAEVVRAIRKQTTKPLMVKLSPNVTDITKIAKSVEAEGADSISLINTITGMAIDIETRRPKIRQYHRRAFRSGDQTGGFAYGLAGGANRQRSGGRHRRHNDRKRCTGVFDRRRRGRSDRNRQFYQSARNHRHYRWHRNFSDGAKYF